MEKLRIEVNDFACWSLGCAYSAIKTLARFHAASIIFEEKRSMEDKSFRINKRYPLEVQKEHLLSKKAKSDISGC
ncbi:unnamed protein product [Acanthoscelides obtectus]|uniref:Uncharacterized protein n=1 Tax=Acanthoscelides obtectus TaxID=200917 RepID=A0A9P0LLC6_ACAOB|nr:unnamed protein product [Acanthoscelides obtectus]CAK1624523.1 hypothetical protein AOBTE_LOCUS2586 [Acanthoscelides obtectus]